MKSRNWIRLLGAGIVVGALFGLAQESAFLTNMSAFAFHRLGIGFWLTYALSTALSLASVWAGFAIVSRRPSRRRAVMIIFALAALMRLYGLAGWLIHVGHILTAFEGVAWSSPWFWPLLVARAFQMMPYWAPVAIFQVILLSCALTYLIATRRDPEFQPRVTVTPIETAPPETHRIVAAKIADGPDWRNALLTSLHKAAAPETQRQRAWPWVIALIAVAALAFLASTFAEQAIAALDPTWRPLAWLVFTFISLGALGLPFAAIRRRMLQARQRRAEDALNKSRAERPIFYLRSFALDEEVGRPSILELFLNAQPANPEQTMTHALGRCGPLIAIGRPGEQLPALGAARFYVAQDLWQEKVADIATVARLVVWASGTTPGLQWEITHLVRSLTPGKLVLWAHPHLLDLDADEREAQWASFVDGLGGLFPKPLPKPLGATRLFAFDSEFTPIPFANRGFLFLDALTASLHALLRFKAVPPYD
jgi:hypothetical protein